MTKLTKNHLPFLKVLSLTAALLLPAGAPLSAARAQALPPEQKAELATPDWGAALDTGYPTVAVSEIAPADPAAAKKSSRGYNKAEQDWIKLQEYNATTSILDSNKEKAQKKLEAGRKVIDYYASLEQESFNKETLDKITSGFDKGDKEKISKLLGTIENLTNSAAGNFGAQKGIVKMSYEAYSNTGWFYDSTIENDVQDVTKLIKKQFEDGKLTQAQLDQFNAELSRLVNVGFSRARKAAQIAQDNEALEDMTKAQSETFGDGNIHSPQKCPTVDELKLKYYPESTGCWACLLVEKLVSTFLRVAEKAYGISQRAGLVLLGIGAIMWVLMWGLKNLSSLTQLDIGNILNDLFKFFFKVALAYTFIMVGLSAVGHYFINPIMEIGSQIAANYWSQDLGQFEIYEGEYNEKEINEAFKKAEQEQNKLIKEGKLDELAPDPGVEVTEEDKEALENARQRRLAAFDGVIPAFQMPGTTGVLTSTFGCRPPPKTSKGTGSTLHLGIDIGAPSGTPVYAIGSGKISYSSDSGTGYMASITHDGAGTKWNSVYYHMLPSSSNFAIGVNRKAGMKDLTYVAQGQQIGFVGNTGNSGGFHLHLGIKYNGSYVNPLALANKKIEYAPRCSGNVTEATRTPTPAGFVRGSTTFKKGGFMLDESAPTDISETYVMSSGGALVTPEIGDIKYTGPTRIMSASIMNNILNATKAIMNTTAQNMVLGDAIQCYAKLEKGGAWVTKITILGELIKKEFSITNGIMWLEGALIWCAGFMLTIAVVYYLLDICFKVGFAVIALPIVVALWPFNMTKGKLANCLSIIFKASATFAFLAITTYYSMNLISAGLEGSPTDVADETTVKGDGLNTLLNIIDRANSAQTAVNKGEEINEQQNASDMAYVAKRLEIFSIDFVILMFCFIYSYKLIGATISKFVNKFFPDSTFGNVDPMHKMSTATTKWLKDQAVKPAALARDIAMHQGGRALKGAMKKPVGMVAGAIKGGGRNAGANAGAAAGQGVKAAGKGIEKAGQGIKNISKAANAIPVVGQAISAAGGAVGTAVQATGKGVQAAGEGIKKASQAMKKKPEGEKSEDKPAKDKK